MPSAKHIAITNGIIDYLSSKGDLESAKSLGYLDSNGKVTDKGYKDIMPLAVSAHKRRQQKIKKNPLVGLFKEG